MANMQNTKMGKGKESKAATLAGLTKLPATMPLGASVSSSRTMTATTLNGSPKIWTSAELEVLRTKIGLVAGALADFQRSGGLVAVRQIDVDGRSFAKILLVAEGINIEVKRTVDGIDFYLVAEADK